MKIGAKTDIGHYRKVNEDSFFTYKNEKIIGGMVADGMGGHNAGDIASKMASDLIKSGIMNRYYPKMDYMQFSDSVKIAIVNANEDIYRKAKVDMNASGMGTTVAAAFVYDGKLITANVGDSRVYAIKDDEITQITKDHSYVEELVEQGKITKDDAQTHPQKNLITRAVGTEAFVQVDMTMSTYNDEIILICSDGLSNLVSEEQMIRIVNEFDDYEKACCELVDLANKKGGMDNITCVIFDKRKDEER